MALKFLRNTLAPVLALLVTACSDTLGPLTQQNDSDMPEIAAGKGKGSNSGGGTSHDPASYVLRHDASAPPLETYQLSFWATKGTESHVKVDYVDSPVGNRNFLQFTVPAQGLWYFPDGTRVSNGDSVLITLTIDPAEFDVQFAPSGLKFSNNNPAVLTTWYELADPDVDRDGDVDSDDTAIIQGAISFFHHTNQDGWSQVSSDNQVTNKKIVAQSPTSLGTRCPGNHRSKIQSGRTSQFVLPHPLVYNDFRYINS